MWKYTFKRLMWAIFTLWVIITITFLLMKLIPGDPFAREGSMPPAVYHNLQQYYHLDKPEIVQYGLYLKSLLQLDFGPSMKYQTLSVNDYIKSGFPVSLHLGLQALMIAVTFGLILGIIASLHRNRWLDYFATIIAIIGVSVPSFILATLLIHVIAVEWGVLPVATWKSWKHTILPSISLAMMPMAYITRLMRSSMLEVLSQDYIMTAKAKGLSNQAVIIKHALRNAILPIITVLGTLTANLITGSFIIEHIFGIPGMGEMFVKSIFNRDYSVILGSTVFYSAILIFLLFIVDILYTWIDPRIKMIEEKS